MISFLILIGLLALIIVGVHRASSKERPRRRKQREPFLSAHDSEALMEAEDYVSIPRIVVPSATARNVDGHEHSPAYSASPTQTAKATTAFSAEASRTEHSATSSFTKAKPSSTQIVVLHLFANPNRPYRGYELLQTLLTAGLRYSKRGIFHRYADITGRDTVLFSLASAMEPGIFDLPNMSGFSTPGLILYLQVDTVQQPLTALNLMISTAKEIAQDLGGELYDEQRHILTVEKIGEWRNQLQMHPSLPV